MFTQRDISLEEYFNASYSVEEPSKKQKLDYLHNPPKKSNNASSGMKAFQLQDILKKCPIQFCQHLELIASSVTCYCGQPMNLAFRSGMSDGFQWCCKHKKTHCSTLSIRKGTWFENSRLAISDILWIAYMWVYQYSYSSMIHETDQTSHTLLQWNLCCQETCKLILESKKNPIGGSDKIVEIFEYIVQDERKSKKQNDKKENNKKRKFCALQHFSTNLICFTLENANSDAVCEILDEYILSGTTVFGNAWNSFVDLNSVDFEYFTMEKEITFYDFVTKTEIDTIEKFWEIARRQSPGLNVESGPKFYEKFYRKSLSFATDPFITFLKDTAMTCKPQKETYRKETSKEKHNAS
ncbi:DDE_Tnp_IS1595 domain-containing protein [Caerostris extrusa]|uniref:DDE_Tnp_IS1595 domain-containing protein n=1 Tax=Caerostris extrusa TaxID=172846 RepID=A0AAV4PF05_CAEEX|nr:DDE_Tnp_IS1595 domain-containing protein [Caerostris extrusa]